jgi:hypothetical protein
MQKARKTAGELDAIVRAEAARILGPWPVGLRMLIFPLGDNWRATYQPFPAKRAHDSSRPCGPHAIPAYIPDPPGLRSAGFFRLRHSIGQKRACYGLSAPRQWGSPVRADV